MISIRVISGTNEYPLALGNLSQTSIEEFTSYLDIEAAIKSGYTMNVTIPVEGNEVLLDQRHLIWSRDNNEAFKIRIYDGQQSFDASLIIEKSVLKDLSSTYDCNIIFSTFPVLINEVLLKDAIDQVITFGSDVNEMVANITAYANSTWPDAPCSFPETRLIGKDAYTVIANQWIANMDEFNNPGTDNNVFSNPTIPHPFYFEVLQAVFKKYGYRLKGNALNDETLKSQVMPSYAPSYDVRRHNELELVTTEDQVINSRIPITWHEIAWNSSDWTPTMPGTEIYPAAGITGGTYQRIEIKLVVKSISPGGKVRIYRRPFGTYDGFGTRTWIDFFALPGDVIEYSWAPKRFNAGPLYMSEVNCVDDFLEWWELGVDGDTENDDDVEFVLGAGSSIKQFFCLQTPFDIHYSPLPEIRRYMKTSMNLNEMVPPEIKVSDFLLAFKQAFQLDIDIDESAKIAYVNKATDKIKNHSRYEPQEVVEGYTKEHKETQKFVIKWANQDVDLTGLKSFGSVPSKYDLTGFALANSFVYIMAENAYYKSVDGEWKFFGLRNRPWEYGNGDKLVEFTIPIELIEMRTDDEGDAYGILPTLLHDTSGPYSGVKSEDWKLMIMSYLGIVNTGSERTKAFATSAGFDYRGDYLPVKSHIFNNQEISMFVAYHEPLLKMLSSASYVTIRVPQNYSLVKSLIRDKNVYWKSSEFLVVRTEGVLGDLDSNTEIELLLK